MPEVRDTPGAQSASIGLPRRLLFVGLGLLCVGLGLIGVFVPGLPTTIFLIAASYLLVRGSPALERRLLRLRVFRPFLPYVRGDVELSMRSRVIALVAMWTAVGVSLSLLALGDRLEAWVVALVTAAAVVGTYFILTFRRGRSLERRPVKSRSATLPRA